MKKILITGGSSDIAFELIKELDSLYDITYTCSSDSSLDNCKAKYKDFKSKGILYNFTDNQKLENFDIVILNACSKMIHGKKLHEIPTEQHMEYITPNLTGNLNILNQLLPGMVSKKFGRIVFISSLSSIIGTSKYSSYIMLKSALEGLMKNIAVDYGPINILANSLRLGLIKTSRNRMLWKRKAYQDIVHPLILQERMGEASDIVPPVKSLIVDNCYINGQEINISGGLPLPNSSGFNL